MRKWKKLRQIAASAMAAVMMVTAMPVGGVAYGDVVSGAEILGAEGMDEVLASGSNCEYGKVSDSDAVEAKVMAADPGVMLLASASVDMREKLYITGLPEDLSLSNDGTYNGNNYTITNRGNNEFKLGLSGFSGDTIQITDGVWEIEVNGINTLNTPGHVLLIENNVPGVTITGDGELNLNSSKTGSGIAVGNGAALIIDGSVTVNATASDGNGEGIDIGEDSTMTVKNGKVTAKQNGAHGQGIYIREGGTLDVQGGDIDTKGNFTGVYSAGGHINVSKGKIETDSIVIGNESKSTIEITGSGEIDTGSIEVNNGTIKIDGRNAKLISTGDIEVNHSPQITLDNGIFSLGGTYSGNKLVYNGGEISGNGTFEDSAKMDTEIACDSTTPSVSYQETVDVAQYFKVPNNRTVEYTMNFDGLDENERGMGTLNGSTLSISKVGKFKITAEVKADQLYAAASNTITLKVAKANFDEIIVKPYTGIYDGESHPAVTVEMNEESLIGKEQYQILYVECTDSNVGISNEMYSYEIPTVKNVSDTGKNYQVLIRRENYSDKVIGLGQERVEIKPRNMASVTVSLAENEYIYNRNEQVPVVEAKLMKDGQTIETLTNADYTVTWQAQDSNTQLSPSGKPIDMGTYCAVLTAKKDGNFTGSTNSLEFEIKPKMLRPQIEGNLTKTYDGTNRVNSDIKIVLKDDRNGQIENSAAATAGSIRYDSADAGSNITITASEISISSNGKGNYTLAATNTVAFGTILNAELKNVSVEQVGTLTYSGTPQSALVSTSAEVPYGNNKIVAYTYAASKYGTYGETVPMFTDAGRHTVYYKASLKNYNDWKGEFEVEIQPGDLSGAVLELTPDQAVYNGQEQKPEVKVTLNGTELPKEDYEIEFRQGSEVVTPKAAGTYTVAAYGKGNLLGTNTPQKTFTIKKAKAPTLDDIKVSYSFGATGTKTVDIVGLPEDIGTYFGAAAEISSDVIHALGNSVTVDGTKVTFELLGNKKENIGKTSEILVKNIETQNYEDAVFKILVTMDPKKEQGAVSGEMTFTLNSDDETFTAEIAAVDGAEYSFDGETWSDENQKVDCFADTSYTGYIRMKETEELYAGPKTAVTAVSPKAYAKTPVITPDGGSFWSKQEVVIESATKDAKIYYTLDGTEPTTESSLYTAPFELREKATVKAIAVKEHLENSAVATAEFTRNYSSSDSDDYEPETGKGSGASGSGNTAGAAGRTDNGTITKDAIKGVISSVNGIITGATNSTAHDGYSHWMKDENGWWLRYNDGSYPKGTKSSGSTSDTFYGWEQINGAWWAFDENGYMRSGWVLDAAFGGWFYVDEDHGMQTGWFFINGKWYYLNPVSDGRRGIMYVGTKTPGGWYVGEDGSWDGLAK